MTECGNSYDSRQTRHIQIDKDEGHVLLGNVVDYVGKTTMKVYAWIEVVNDNGEGHEDVEMGLELNAGMDVNTDVNNRSNLKIGTYCVVHYSLVDELTMSILDEDFIVAPNSTLTRH